MKLFTSLFTVAIVVNILVLITFSLVSASPLIKSPIGRRTSIQATQDNTSASNDLVIPKGVTLVNYNTTEFSILVGNITTNLTIAQESIVMTDSIAIVPIVSIPVRVILTLFDIFLIVLVILLRNYEPVKSKFNISLMLVIVNIVGHIQGIIEILPGAPLFFETYWKQFILEKSTNQIDALTFYKNNLNSMGIPTWLEKFAQYESIYCFFNAYLIFGFTIIGLSIYSIQIIKLMMLLLLKDKRQAIVKALEEFKRKQVEKFKNIKAQAQKETSDRPLGSKHLSKKINFGDSMENLGKQSTVDSSSPVSSVSSSVGILDLSILQQQTLGSTSSEPLTPRSNSTFHIENEDPNMAFEDIALDLTTDDDALSTSYEEISMKTRFVNLLKKIIKYRVIELSYTIFWLSIWFIIVTVQILLHQTDPFSILFKSWDSYSGYCRHIDRVLIVYYSLIVLFIIFAFIPITLCFDFVTSLVKYVRIRRINKEKGRKTDNFFIFYFYETDPFVYRTEVLAVLIIDTITVIAFLIVAPTRSSYTDVISQGQELAGSLLISICLNFIGGSLSNPGITIARAIWNFGVASKSKMAKSTNPDAITSLQQLVSSPICAESIDFVLSHKAERDLFYQYVKEEYSIENLLFTEDVVKLRNINNAHGRAKVLKIKEMVKLYLSDMDSVFELNVPSKLIQNELSSYRQLVTLLDQLNLKASQLPRVIKDSNNRYFPNVDPTMEETLKQLISQLSQPHIFAGLQSEVYKNLLDSYYRFNNSRKWKDYVKSASP